MPGTLRLFRKKKYVPVQSNPQLNALLDPYWANVVLAMHMDSLVDEKGHVVTNSGAATSSSVSMFGGKSTYLNGTSNYLTVPASNDFVLGSGDFTVEVWVFPTKENALYGESIVSTYIPNAPGDAGWTLYFNRTSPTINLGFGMCQQGGAVGGVGVITGSPVSLNTWHHIAATRKNGTFYLFLDGNLVASNTSNVIDNYLGTLMIGTGNGANMPDPNVLLGGYIDDLRITKGVARYTSNFTVPSTPIGDWNSTDYYWDNTVALAHGSSLSDLKTSLTVQGVTTSSSNYKFGPGSFYFNGSSYLGYGASPDFDLNQNFYTFETWAYITRTGVHTFASFGSARNGAMWLGTNSYTQLTFSHYGVNQNPDWTTTGSTLTINTWHHIALVKNGSSYTLFVDGRSSSAGTVSLTWQPWSNDNFYIGTQIGYFNYLTGYLEDIRFTKGIARYTQAFTVPNKAFSDLSTDLAYDPYWQQTTLLMHMDDFTDKKGATVTPVGSPTISPSGRLGGCLTLDSSGGQYVSVPTSMSLAFGTGDFTVEKWVKLNAYSSVANVVIDFRSNTGGYYYAESINQGKVILYINNAVFIQSASTIPLNTWMYIAFSRVGSTTRLFINGVLDTTVTDTNNYLAPPVAAYIGGVYWSGQTGTPAFGFNGYIDDLRITKGVARYTGNFTPPTYQFQNQ